MSVFRNTPQTLSPGEVVIFDQTSVNFGTDADIVYVPATGIATLQPGTYAASYGVSILRDGSDPDAVPKFQATLNGTPIPASILSPAHGILTTGDQFQAGTIDFIFSVPAGGPVAFAVEYAPDANGDVLLDVFAQPAVTAFLTLEQVAPI